MTTAAAAGLTVCALLLLTGCRGDSELLGRFGGDWDVGGAVMLTYADGGGATASTGSHVQKSESEVVVSTNDHKRYDVTIDTPFMACTLTAHINDDKELVLDGPTTAEVSESNSGWQHCPFTLDAYRGEANVRGTVRSKPGGSLTITMQVLPVGSANARVNVGSAASFGFVGNRSRTVSKK
jgi:hypothetical protein